jgi:hypothetical protein
MPLKENVKVKCLDRNLKNDKQDQQGKAVLNERNAHTTQ